MKTRLFNLYKTAKKWNHYLIVQSQVIYKEDVQFTDMQSAYISFWRFFAPHKALHKCPLSVLEYTHIICGRISKPFSEGSRYTVWKGGS